MKQKRNLTENLFELELLLLERERTQNELIEHFGVDRKTIRRAIDKLSPYRFVTEERRGRNTVYGCRRFESPVLTLAEISALVLAQEAIRATGKISAYSPFAVGADSLLEKVREKLPTFLRHKLDSLAAIFGSAVVPAKDFTGHSETIEVLIRAAEEQRQCVLDYYSFTSNRITSRRFDPYSIYFDPDGATLKVIGYDDKRRQIVPFSIDHIKRIRLTKDKFERPADFDVRRFLEQNCFNGIHGALVTVRLKAFGTTARIFAERQFHPSQKIIAQQSETSAQEAATTIEMLVASGRGLERFVLGWLPDVEVLAPADLREKIADIQGASLRRHCDK